MCPCVEALLHQMEGHEGGGGGPGGGGNVHSSILGHLFTFIFPVRSLDLRRRDLNMSATRCGVYAARTLTRARWRRYVTARADTHSFIHRRLRGMMMIKKTHTRERERDD